MGNFSKARGAKLTSRMRTLFVLHLLASVNSFDRIAEYVPGSDVTQHSRLDLDQRDLMSFLAKQPPDFEAAKRIYTEGGNSGKTTEIKLGLRLNKDYPADSLLTQKNSETNSTAKGKLNARAKAGDDILKVGITSSCKGEAASQPDVSGCFRKSDGDPDENLKIQGSEDLGNVTEVQLRWRTLAGFSTAAEQKMSGQMMFELFNNYYGLPDYADEFIRAALFGKSGTGSRIPFDFTGKPDIFRVECAQKASAYWSVWMYVIREMEDALQDCTAGCHTCNEAPVHAWDEAWAFYAGSLEGFAGNSDGKMLYRLAEKRCKNFGTCQGGIAGVNKQILNIFISGKTSLAEGRCSEVRPMITKIVNLMTVPLIQGTLRYAFKTKGGKGGAKDKTEGVAFLGAFLPRLHNCSTEDADTVRRLMWIDGKMGVDSFSVVRKLLERNYTCMGISCSQVGALLDEPSGVYLAGEPCQDPGLSAGATAGIVIAVILALLLVLGVLLFLKKRPNIRSESKFSLF